MLHTCRPTRLLWILMRAWMSRGDPRESSQSLENRSPKRTSWLQPPHSQVSCMELSSSGKGLSRAEGWAGRRLAGRSPWLPFSSEGNDRVMPRPTPPFCRVCSCSCESFSRILSSSCRRLASQPHPRSLPMLQAEATEWATPAANKAREKALSRKPRNRTHRRVKNDSTVVALKQSCICDQNPHRPWSFGPALACLRLSPLLRMVLWWGSLPRPSSVEQFQRWSRSWCWHSWMATWMPCRAEAVTSGLRTHIRIWRLLRPASLRHTELGVRTGSPATFRLRISLHSTLQRGRRGREKELVWGVIRAGQEFISQIQRSMWQLEDVLDSHDNQKNTKRFKDKLENVSNLKGIWRIKLTIKRVNRLHKNLQVFPLMLLQAGKNIILNRSSSWEIINAEDKLQNTFYGKITTKLHSLWHCLDFLKKNSKHLFHCFKNTK